MRKWYSFLSLILLASCGDGGAADARPPNAFDAAVIDAPDDDGGAPDAPIPDGSTPDSSPSRFDAAPRIDADTTPDGSVGTVCGSDVCDGTEQCCTEGGGGGPPTQTCIPLTDTCPGLGTTCDGPEDCRGGDVCCGTLAGASCSATCAGLELCHTTPDCTMGICCPGLGGVSVCLMATTCP